MNKTTFVHGLKSFQNPETHILQRFSSIFYWQSQIIGVIATIPFSGYSVEKISLITPLKYSNNEVFTVMYSLK